MSVKTTLGLMWARRRAKQIDKNSRKAISIQRKTFSSLIQQGAKTAFGKEHGFSQIKSYQDFQKRVPVRSYETAKNWFDRIYKGEVDVSWPGLPLYLAKTSGTTSGAKYIPITKASIRKQVAAARDALLLYMAETGNADFLNGKMMFLSGSPEIEKNEYGIPTGRLSGIVNHFVPSYLQTNRVPTYQTNIIADWEEKVAAIVKEISQQDLRLISGIPPWVQMMFEELESQSGKMPLDVWPNLQVFVQGGVNFQPYKPIFDNYFGDRVDMVETFPASEGFFAFQNSQKDDGLLLLPDYGVFFEFIPLDAYGSPDAQRLTLEDVQPGENYALIVTTNAGLWAYDIGDTVKFTSINPWKVRVSGRVKHFISAFGEHVIGEEVDHAIMVASQKTGAHFQEFTVGPDIKESKGSSRHEWLIEFIDEPDSIDTFVNELDQELRRKNPYYEDLRAGNILAPPCVKALQLNASRNYMKSIGKLGGQNKFPRLSNNRKMIEALYPYLKKE